jgi:hypothetical protein
MATRKVRTLRIASLGCALGLATVFACSSDHPPAGVGSSGGPGDDSSSGGPGADQNSPDSGDASPSTVPFGNLPTVDEPDIPCVPTTAPKITLYTAADSGGLGAPPVQLLQSFGSGRFASGPNLPGYLTFDVAGTNPRQFSTAFPGAVVAYVSQGTNVGAFVGDSAVTYQRYDANGATVGAPVSIAPAGAPVISLTAASDDAGGAMVVWAAGTVVKVAYITPAGTLAGTPWTLSPSASSVRVALAAKADKYLIVYAHTVAADTFGAVLQLADSNGAVGAPSDLAKIFGQLMPAGVAPTTPGWLLSFDGGGDDRVYLVPLTPTGAVAGPVHRLLGGDAPWALASAGTSVGVVSMSNDVITAGKEGPRAPRFRPVDATGHPLGPWVCLDNPVPPAQYQDMSVIADGSGWSIVYKSPVNTTVLMRTNALGTAGP